MTTITISEKTGRMANGANSDHGIKTHARINGARKALCGTQPGRTADWSSYSKTMDIKEAERMAEKLITCEKCKDNLYKWDTRPRFDCGDYPNPF